MLVMAIILRVLVAVVAIAIPLGFAGYWKQHQLQQLSSSPWRLFRIGCATFVISQIFHIPFNLVILKYVFGMGNGNDNDDASLQDEDGGFLNVFALAIFAGLSAGCFEEITRYLAYKYYLLNNDDRTFNAAIMFGVGHGGMESILLVGLAGLVQVIGMTYLQIHKDDLSSVGIPEDQIEAVKEQLQQYWDLPWYELVMSDIERIFAMICHLAMTVLVLQCFLVPNNNNNNNNIISDNHLSSIIWLLAAIGWHALIDATAVLLISTTTNIYVTELAIGGFAAASIWILLKFKRRDELDYYSYEEIDDAAAVVVVQQASSQAEVNLLSEQPSTFTNVNNLS